MITKTTYPFPGRSRVPDQSSIAELGRRQKWIASLLRQGRSHRDASSATDRPTLLRAEQSDCMAVDGLMLLTTPRRVGPVTRAANAAQHKEGATLACGPFWKSSNGGGPMLKICHAGQVLIDLLTALVRVLEALLMICQ